MKKEEKKESTNERTELNKKKQNDRFLLAVILIIALAAGILMLTQNMETGMTAVVTVDGKELGRYSLLQEKEIAIGDTNVLIIKDGAADMISAKCPDQVCVKHTPVSKNSETIICLPNRVVVTIEAINGKMQSDETLDAVVK